MTGVVVFTCVAAVVFFVLACMDQRKFYWTFSSWRYADPEANEPSAAARTMNRVWLLVSCALCLGTAVYALDFDGSGAYSAVEVKAVAKAVASDLERGSGSGFRSSAGVSSEVHDTVREESDGLVEVDGGTDGYELTNVDGENPVCLVVDIERDFDPGGPDGGFVDGGDAELWSHSVSASVRDGPC
ncbi:hypothetical protein [Actinomadura sp. WMMB 499]|uniref:hypothetical protein n=1 Tax=Actinomadura sp. WMMB 499 TaxID=1219491 RepID=UPI001245E371|nr:hypothetical protein [Actinomadura sp. WMMB 499]QFG22759.1 hypothetical protein F7P10_18185 [Actinomadura sp. WMMB 499]